MYMKFCTIFSQSNLANFSLQNIFNRPFFEPNIDLASRIINKNSSLLAQNTSKNTEYTIITPSRMQLMAIRSSTRKIYSNSRGVRNSRKQVMYVPLLMAEWTILLRQLNNFILRRGDIDVMMASCEVTPSTDGACVAAPAKAIQNTSHENISKQLNLSLT